MRILALLLALVLLPIAAKADPIWFPTINNQLQVQTTSNIATATTTAIYTCPAGFNCWFFYVGSAPTGSNSASTSQVISGGNATCSSGTIVHYNAQPLNNGAAAGNQPVTLFGAGAIASTMSLPFMIPAGSSVCIVTAGTTIAVEGTAFELNTPI